MANPEWKAPRVLIVEDEYIIAEDIAVALRGMRATVIGPTATAHQALEMLASEEPIDAAILDVRAKDDLTFDVADRLRSERIPFVFVTGFDAGDLPPSYRETKMWTKPFDVDLVARAVLAEV